MSNMAYCRFQNTVPDLEDCYEHLYDDDLSNEEERARNKLIEVCQQIASDTEIPPDKE